MFRDPFRKYIKSLHYYHGVYRETKSLREGSSNFKGLLIELQDSILSKEIERSKYILSRIKKLYGERTSFWYRAYRAIKRNIIS